MIDNPEVMIFENLNVSFPPPEDTGTGYYSDGKHGSDWEVLDDGSQSPILLNVSNDELDRRGHLRDLPTASVTFKSENKNENNLTVLLTHGYDAARVHGLELQNIKFKWLADEYSLVDIHFHRKAEHLFTSSSFSLSRSCLSPDVSFDESLEMSREPLECHCVFADQSGTPRAVFAFVFVESDIRCAFLDVIPFSLVCPHVENQEIILPLDSNEHLFDLLDPSRRINSNMSLFFNYSGSLTTPPCTGPISWFIKYSFATSDQINYFNHLLYLSPDGLGNFRACQPINNRGIRIVKIRTEIQDKDKMKLVEDKTEVESREEDLEDVSYEKLRDGVYEESTSAETIPARREREI